MKFLKCAYFLMFIITPTRLMCMEKTTTVIEEQTKEPVANKSLEPYTVLEAVDKKSNKVTLECYKMDSIEKCFELQKIAIPVVAEAFADEAYNFLDDNLEVKTEYFDAVNDRYEKTELESLINVAALYKEDREKRVEINRQKLEESIEEDILFAKDLQGQSFVVIAKNSIGEILGFVTFLISPLCTEYFQDFADGDVVLEPIAVAPKAQGCGLSRLLVFSILTLMPETKRILLGTKIWNTKAQAVYRSLGFSVYSQKSASIKFVYFVNA